MLTRKDFDSEYDYIEFQEQLNGMLNEKTDFSDFRHQMRSDLLKVKNRIYGNPEDTQQIIANNHERKEEALKNASAPQLTPQEKLRALQMGKTVTQASQTNNCEKTTQPSTQSFNSYAFYRIQQLRNRLNS